MKTVRRPGTRRTVPSQPRQPCIALRIEEPRWRDLDLQKLRDAARRAQKRAGHFGELTVLLTTDDRLSALNGQHRGKYRPTNVLAFPAGRNVDGYLGDIAVAFGVAAGEAAASGKLLDDHAAHLIVHGLLHLVGYDHRTAQDARRMEGLEVDILREMGIADPYGSAH